MFKVHQPNERVYGRAWPAYSGMEAFKERLHELGAGQEFIDTAQFIVELGQLRRLHRTPQR
jgi:hypothetical protein